MGKTLEFTKKIGDKVWIMYDNRPVQLRIARLVYYVDLNGLDVKAYDVSDCFDTEEELLKSL